VLCWYFNAVEKMVSVMCVMCITSIVGCMWLGLFCANNCVKAKIY